MFGVLFKCQRIPGAGLQRRIVIEPGRLRSGITAELENPVFVDSQIGQFLFGTALVFPLLRGKRLSGAGGGDDEQNGRQQRKQFHFILPCSLIAFVKNFHFMTMLNTYISMRKLQIYYMVAKANYSWWNPLRYIVMNHARRFGNICQLFGWAAWCSPCECAVCKKKRGEK